MSDKTSKKRKRTPASTSSSRRSKKAPDIVAGQVPDTMVQKATSQVTRKQTMADKGAIPSIIEYTENVDEQERPDPLPAVEYEAVIKGVENKIGKASGNPYAAVDFYIGTDQFPADYPVENNPDGLTITYRRVSLQDTPKGRYGVKTFCEAVGAKPPKRSLDTSEWVGLVAKVGIVHEDIEGVIREQIGKVSSL